MVAVAGLFQHRADFALRVVGFQGAVGNRQVLLQLLAAKFRIGAACRFPVFYLQVVLHLPVQGQVLHQLRCCRRVRAAVLGDFREESRLARVHVLAVHAKVERIRFGRGVGFRFFPARGVGFRL